MLIINKNIFNMEWRRGEMEKWRNGEMAKGRRGEMEK